MTAKYLMPDDQREYLYEHGYFRRGSVNDDDLERLSRINFHHFLGYARNLRRLRDEGAVNSEITIEQVFEIIRAEHELTEMLFGGMRQAEWNLRALAVKYYCSLFDSSGSFLSESQFRSAWSENDPREIISSIVASVLRYGEPFVANALKKKAIEKEVDLKQIERDRTFYENRDLLQDLDLWSIIDSFSMGQLSKFILQCTPAPMQSDGCPSEKNEVWRNIARELQINSKVFHTNIQSLTVLRNLVAHNVRLWMKPMPYAPRKANLFKRALRDSDEKSMHVAFANVALFQPTTDGRDVFFRALDSFLDERPLYRLGVTKVSRRSVQ